MAEENFETGGSVMMKAGHNYAKTKNEKRGV
jgi:hypothetical protein